MLEYTIDLKNAKTLWTLHEAIKKGLMLPDYYGMNLDALWDCLIGDIETPSIIYIKSFDCLPKELCKKGEVMKQLIYEAKEWYNDMNIKLDVIEL